MFEYSMQNLFQKSFNFGSFNSEKVEKTWKSAQFTIVYDSIKNIGYFFFHLQHP